MLDIFNNLGWTDSIQRCKSNQQNLQTYTTAANSAVHLTVAAVCLLYLLHAQLSYCLPSPSVNLVRISSRGARSPINLSQGGKPRPDDLTVPSSCICTKTLSPFTFAVFFWSSTHSSHSAGSWASSCHLLSWWVTCLALCTGLGAAKPLLLVVLPDLQGHITKHRRITSHAQHWNKTWVCAGQQQKKDVPLCCLNTVCDKCYHLQSISPKLLLQIPQLLREVCIIRRSLQVTPDSACKARPSVPSLHTLWLPSWHSQYMSTSKDRRQ